MIRLIRTTTPATTQVRRVASWRVGQTTLRSSKRDSARNSRVTRPFALNMTTASAATRPPTTAPMRSPVDHWPMYQQKANTPPTTSSTPSAYIATSDGEADLGSSTPLLTTLRDCTFDGLVWGGHRGPEEGG